ncbi:MAG: restriction endonuclease [Candidatus Electrothrix sp. AW5]|nr:restriction endonuclease [Candidatus Electrothrix gigas]
MEKPIQKILFGGPGTGKSWWIDNRIIPDELGIKKEETPENIIKTVFHPEYTHGDFMGKLVPITRSEKIHYDFYEGDFLKALSQAYKNIISSYDINGEPREDCSVKNVVLVIDEINRGNSAAIFGSVFQLLDRDDEGWSDYYVNVNEIILIKILELIGVKFYDQNGKIDKYELKPHIPYHLEEFQKKIEFLKFDLINRTIKLPYNLSILATMNTSESSIYYMDSAFKRRWEWEFMDIDSNKPVCEPGVAFETRDKWKEFIKKINAFIKSNYKYIRGIEDKQIGFYFIKDDQITKEVIQSKLMFFLWDNVFTRDKKPLIKLCYGEDAKYHDNLITFGDFAKQVDLFIRKINTFGNV